MSHARRIERYYAWLDRLTQLHVMRSESGSQAQPIHRALRDPAGGPPSPSVIHRLILDAVALPPSPRVLDAGCGYGATAFDLQPQTGGTCLPSSRYASCWSRVTGLRCASMTALALLPTTPRTCRPSGRKSSSQCKETP